MLFLSRRSPSSFVFGPVERVPGLFEKEGVSMRGFLLVVLAAVTAVTAALGMLGEPGERAVQIVYESDTRGYYLPCG